ncbi:tetratricopeptide repeat protein [Kitasatospora sp. DSM 101779]|uniref:tetratricopeptide repeat protein n=1 Tax=Kitasatospora sp. DSM 101779 TaxID=2853165 RepID=UPI0021D9EA69|nr:tetratricopeptide repeat protein [Kitasatospora sp. DSM 101779]MCU7820910.1 tetratricopeptide repeat protein [Kitasatospora sp. DSM 101779]
MDESRLVAVQNGRSRSSGYAIGPRLVLASAHGVGPVGHTVRVWRPGHQPHHDARVVWRGTPEGRDDAALLHIDDPSWQEPPGRAESWGRMATMRPGQQCETWGVPHAIQIPGRPGQPRVPVEPMQLVGTVNPGTGYVGNRYFLALTDHPVLPGGGEGELPWAGLSGAAVTSGGLLVGVVKAEAPEFGHGLLEVVPAYVLHADKSFLKALEDHGADSSTLGQSEFDRLRRTDAPGPTIGPLPPAALLQAGREVVGFHGREEILGRLKQWCEPTGFGVRLLHGSGGQGKTRLAARLAEALQEDDPRWTVLWPDPAASPEELAELQDTAKPVLVVLDYAEARLDQLSGLLEAGRSHRGSVPLKVLLLARTAGGWWQHAKTAPGCAPLLRAAVDELPALAPDRATRALLYRQALTAFAGRLTDPEDVPEEETWCARAEALPAPRPAALASGNVLTLHMTALADLLDAGVTAGEPAWETDEDAEDRILEHEWLYWAQVERERPLPDGLGRGSAPADALATVALIGGIPLRGREREALLRRSPVLADLRAHEIRQVREWVEAVYPVPAGDPWEVLQPDRLAERFVGRHVLSDPEFVDSLLAEAEPGRMAVRALTVLSRAAAHPPLLGSLDGLIAEVCTRHAGSLGTAMMEVATQVERPQPLIDALQRRVDSPETSLAALETLTAHLPRSSHVLVPWALNLTERMIRLRTATGTGSAEDGIALGIEHRRLAGRLTDAGRPAEALAAAEKAVELLEPLLTTHHETVRVPLAAALTNKSGCLGAVGRRSEALPPAGEAVAHFRAAAASDRVPDSVHDQLVTALGVLSSAQSDLGHHTEALETMTDAVAVQRRLVLAGAPGAVGDLVLRLNNLAIRLNAVGHFRDALDSAAEAVALCEPLSERHPDAYAPDMAMALSTLADCHGRLGDRRRGLLLTRRAIGIRERLYRELPDMYRPSLALALNSLATDLGELGQVEEAVEAAARAVVLYREVVAQRDGHRDELAMSLNTLANQCGDAGDTAGAVAAAREAARIYTQLHEEHPGVFAASRAMILATLATCLDADRQPEAALDTALEAVAAYHELTRTQPRTIAPNFAGLLRNLRCMLVGADRAEEALELLDAALACYAGSTEALYPVVEELLIGRAMCLDALGRPGEAVATMRRAVRLARRNAGSPSSRGPSEVVGMLELLGAFAFCAGRRTEAAEAAAEAAELLRELAQDDPDRFDGRLAAALAQLRNLLPRLARYGEAETAAREAVAVRRRIAERGGAAERVGVVAELGWLAEVLLTRLRPAEALAVLEQADDQRGRLTADEAAPHESALDLAQRTRGILLLMLGRQDEAEEFVRASVVRAERVSESDPLRTLGRLVAGLAAGSVLVDLERREEALPHLERAVALCRPLAEAGEAGYGALLATCLSMAGTCLGLDPAEPERALEAATEALAISQRLAELDPEAVASGLARVTGQQGLRLAEVGRFEDGLRLTGEAVPIARMLVALDPRAHVLELVDVLYCFAAARVAAGTAAESADALTALDEAVALLRELTEDIPWSAERGLCKAEELRERLVGGQT